MNCATPLTPGLKCSTFVVSSPIQANEDQYLANFDYVIDSKNTLSERFFTSKDPQDQPFVCLGPCQPGAPEDVTYTADSAVLKLTTVVTSNFVNEASFSYQRSTTVAAPGDYLTACGVGITPPIANGNCASVPVERRQSDGSANPNHRRLLASPFRRCDGVPSAAQFGCRTKGDGITAETSSLRPRISSTTSRATSRFPGITASTRSAQASG